MDPSTLASERETGGPNTTTQATTTPVATPSLEDLSPPRTSSEACRDSLLRFLDTPLVQGIGILVLILVILDGAFFFFLLVGWHAMCDTPSRADCDPRNYWYNWSIQVLNVLFTYMNTVSMPWRCTQLIHIMGSCPPRENAVGHGLYGFGNDPDIWYWIPLRQRLGITIILLNNCIMQFANQATRIVYSDFDSQNEFPGNVWTNVFFVASFACGGIGAGWMLYEMGKIREAMPGKFGPGPIDSMKVALAARQPKGKQDADQEGEEQQQQQQSPDVEAQPSASIRPPDPTRESRRRALVGKGDGRSGARLFAM
jgi:Protein of unknown function (DUF2985)